LFTDQQIADLRRQHLLDTAEVYSVGWLATLRYTAAAARHGHRREAASKLRYEAAGSWRLARSGQWRALRMKFNGYLAEIPDHNAGHGWTRRRALRSLDRIIREADQ